MATTVYDNQSIVFRDLVGNNATISPTLLNFSSNNNVGTGEISANNGTLGISATDILNITASNTMNIQNGNGLINLSPHANIGGSYAGSIGYIDAPRQTLTINAGDTTEFDMSFNCSGSYYVTSSSVGNENMYLNLSGVGNGRTGKIGCLDISGNQYLNVESDTGKGLILTGDLSTNIVSNGNIELVPNDNTGDLILRGTNLQSATSGGNSGQHLRIQINNTYYKIRLENDV